MTRPRIRLVLLAVLAAVVVGGTGGAVAGGPMWPHALMLAVLATGVVGGLAATRGRDLLALTAGATAGIWLVQVAMSVGSTSAENLALQALVPALTFAIPTGLVGWVVAGATSLVRTRIGRAIVAGAVAVGLAVFWVFVVAEVRPAQLESYRLLDDRTIVVTAAVPPHAWARVVRVEEGAANVTVEVEARSWTLGPSAGYLENVELTVPLREPLGDRRVMDAGDRELHLVGGPVVAPTGETRTLRFPQGTIGIPAGWSVIDSWSAQVLGGDLWLRVANFPLASIGCVPPADPHCGLEANARPPIGGIDIEVSYHRGVSLLGGATTTVDGLPASRAADVAGPGGAKRITWSIEVPGSPGGIVNLQAVVWDDPDDLGAQVDAIARSFRFVSEGAAATP